MDARSDSFDYGGLVRDPKRAIDLAHEPDFEVGSLTIQPSLRRIEGAGGEIMIEPKMMQVLVALAEEPGAILSRDDLIERCWEGRIVGDASINRIISLLRAALREAGGDAAKIDNVPKVGYRLLVADAQPVFHSDVAQSKAVPDEEPTQPGTKRRNLVIAVVALALAAVAGIVWWQGRTVPLQPMSIAMLPLEYEEAVDPLYAKGLETELRAQMASIGAVDVTTSESARLLVADGLKPEEIGQKLSVDYVWSGSLESGASRVVLSASLVNAVDGAEHWSRQMSSAPNDAQFLPMRAARELAQFLNRPFAGGDVQGTVSASGYQLYLTALGLLKSRGRDQRIAANRIMEQVTAEHPDFANGWALFAKARYLNPARHERADKTNWGEAAELAERALALDPNSVDALKVAGSLAKDRQKGLAMLRRATELDPGDAEAWYWRGSKERDWVLDGGDPEESTRRTVAIDPLWPASWRSSDRAAEFGNMDLARELERDIVAASITPAQRHLAEARLAMLSGDMSGFHEKVVQAAPSQTPQERQFGVVIPLRWARMLMDMEIEERDYRFGNGPPDLVRPLVRGKLPSQAEFQRAGFVGKGFWQAETVAAPAIPMLVAEGRGAELLANHDAMWKTVDEYAAFAEMTGQGDTFIPAVTPYLVHAFREAGRDEDARRYLALAKQYQKRWDDADTGWLVAVLNGIAVAAVDNDKARAVEFVQRLPGYGFPYTSGHAMAHVRELLDRHPIFDSINDLPEVRAVLDPVRANIARERAETLALGI